MVRRARGFGALAALLLAAGACSSILGLDGVEFDDDGGAGGGGGAHCQNLVVDGDESGMDCGGADCPDCSAGQPCNGDGDCRSHDCNDGVCAASCDDGEQNGDEEGVDCGGDCASCGDTEDCAQPGDEDGNLLADCLDPVCLTSQCITLPDGWFGPVTLVPASNQTNCPTGFDVPFGDAFTGVTADDALCEPCSCGPHSGGACGNVTVELYADANCLALLWSAAATGACQLNQLNGIDSVHIPDIPFTPGSCAPSGGMATLPDPVWTGATRVCMGAPVGECAAGPCTPPPPEGAPLCIVQAGDVACPEPWSDRRPLYDPGGEEDTRGCAACVCDAPADALCTPQLNLYSSTSCSFAVDQIVSTGVCNQVDEPDIDAFRLQDLDPPSIACAASGGQAMGSVGPGEAGGTACCLPPERTP